jgi:soluble lytic murein transglycosylase-like protein
MATPADAQIHSWRDAAGQLVLSDMPQAAKGKRTAPLAPASKSAPYEDLISEHAQREQVAVDLVRAVIQVESAFNPSAVSPKGAMGLMQLMPATAVELGVNNPFDPDQNIRGGVTYLRRLLDRYNGRIDLALAAYNAGMGNVEKYGDVPPFKETQNYVRRITGAAPPPPPQHAIYKWFELKDGTPVVRYSNRPPASGSYEVISRR